MARTRTKPEKTEPTGTVQARRNLERQRQKAADQLRQLHANTTAESKKATAQRLKDKPADSRTIVEPDPAAGIL